MRSILFVDENPIVLNNYRYAFAGVPSLWTTFFCVNEIGALQYLCSQNIDIIITDITMPRTLEHNLLAYVKQRFPFVLRIIVSSNKINYEKSIPATFAHCFIEKPSNLEKLKRIVELGYYLHNDLIK